MDKTEEDWNGLNLGKFEKRRPTFFQIYISLYQNVIYKAGKSFSVVLWPWFCKWKTIALLIWRLELIINKIKQNYLKLRDLAPLRGDLTWHEQFNLGFSLALQRYMVFVHNTSWGYPLFLLILTSEKRKKHLNFYDVVDDLLRWVGKKVYCAYDSVTNCALIEYTPVTVGCTLFQTYSRRYESSPYAGKLNGFWSCPVNQPVGTHVCHYDGLQFLGTCLLPCWTVRRNLAGIWNKLAVLIVENGFSLFLALEMV